MSWFFGRWMVPQLHIAAPEVQRVFGVKFRQVAAAFLMHARYARARLWTNLGDVTLVLAPQNIHTELL